ncbi:hypothetical protein P4O66_001701 [Electrophorus voltai]|uniref:Uncharacterized protein n=1 Tax=Electrophorus voltai TaxID=2609070 RepID=A0AAD8Z5H4_9TELE|nr:hypothetical protein P4O66_001701 [Electrophorus voltai]
MTLTSGECATEGFWGGPECGPGLDSAESCRPESDYQDWYSDDQCPELDSAGTYDAYMDYQEGYADREDSREYSDISFRSNSEFDHAGDPLMEVEEVLHKDPPSVMDNASAVCKSNEPLAPNTPPRVSRSGASKLPHVNHRGAASSHQDTPLPKEHSPRAFVPMPKPCRGKKEASPVPATETGKTPPGQFALKPGKLLPPERSRGSPPQASQTST